MKRILVTLLAACLCQGALAETNTVKETVKKVVSTTSGKDLKKLHAELKDKYPELLIDELVESPIKGFYQARLGAQMVYITDDGHYIFYGDILDMDRPKEDQNLTEIARRTARAEMLKQLKPGDMIIYGPTKKPKGIVTIFTDVDCKFSRQLHEDIPELTKNGIQVRYLAYPRSGVNSSSYEKTVSIWCSKNPQDTFGRAVKGDSVPTTTCLNTVASQMEIGQKFGVRGTPTSVFLDGFVMPGYLSADRLAEEAIAHTPADAKTES